MIPISQFTGDCRFLSNFAPCAVLLDGVIYPSVEHAYQAAKTLDPEMRAKLRQAPTAGRAKQWGQLVELRPDWETVRIPIMRKLLEQKFNRDEFKRLLLATGERELIEGNDWGDVFWGMCGGLGENHLGKLLMEIRSKLKESHGKQS